MKPAPFSLSLLAGALLLAGCDGGTRQQAGPRADAQGKLHYGAIAFEPCALAAPGGSSVEAQCATLPVPENHDAPDGRQIELAIALLPAKGMAEADPIYMIAGGPGQSAIESFPMVANAFSDVRRNRHVLLVDARGTGGSNPLLCPGFMDEETLADPANETPEAVARVTEACRDELQKTADLRYYTTGDHIRDLDLVRGKIGVERVNLVGVSYGTRVAQQYAAAYPQHTRSLVLDSVAPNSLVLGQDHARNLEDALDAQFQRCRANEACLTNLGDPRQQLTLVRERLQAGGIAPVRYRDPVSGEWREEVPRFGHLVGLLRMYAYQPSMAATLPLLLHEASQQRYESLLAQSRMLASEMGDSIAMGMSLSVSCSEDAAEFRSDTADADTVLGNLLVDLMQQQCQVWPKGSRSENFRAPLSGDVPVLAISGELDPVTPPRYGDEVVETLPNGRHLVLPGQGHSVLGTGCMPKLFAQFVETADAKSLDAKCLDRLSAQPPFAGNYGWEP
ncbi:alpha/beta hydrolase [Luteimonas viscosa]|uniref:Alpha/beta hydrolase n=1 Tax=Luteimonas viscosa TaxID=1132694 RepID=A0A5D4XPA1_9GAMM|nr:alpha/beta fold hydrolase [Luteimonas viscosa]TYT26507.1 alpha/beta hydrolase [Luteimonas viscosa]